MLNLNNSIIIEEVDKIEKLTTCIEILKKNGISEKETELKMNTLFYKTINLINDSTDYYIELIENFAEFEKKWVIDKTEPTPIHNALNKEVDILLNIRKKLVELTGIKLEDEKEKAVETVKEVKEVKEVKKTNTISLKVHKEHVLKVDFKDDFSGSVQDNSKTIQLVFRGKQKSSKVGYIFEYFKGKDGMTCNHILYVGTTYIDKKYSKMYVVTLEGVASYNLNIINKYVTGFGKETPIGDGLSIINPNFIKLKAGHELKLVE